MCTSLGFQCWRMDHRFHLWQCGLGYQSRYPHGSMTILAIDRSSVTGRVSIPGEPGKTVILCIIKNCFFEVHIRTVSFPQVAEVSGSPHTPRCGYGRA